MEKRGVACVPYETIKELVKPELGAISFVSSPLIESRFGKPKIGSPCGFIRYETC